MANISSIEERIAKLQEKLEQQKQLKKKVEQRQKHQERKQAEKNETRKKILVGACVLKMQSMGKVDDNWLRRILSEFLDRDADRALFDLPAKQSAEKTEEVKPAEAPADVQRVFTAQHQPFDGVKHAFR